MDENEGIRTSFDLNDDPFSCESGFEDTLEARNHEKEDHKSKSDIRKNKPISRTDNGPIKGSSVLYPKVVNNSHAEGSQVFNHAVNSGSQKGQPSSRNISLVVSQPRYRQGELEDEIPPPPPEEDSGDEKDGKEM